MNRSLSLRIIRVINGTLFDVTTTNIIQDVRILVRLYHKISTYSFLQMTFIDNYTGKYRAEGLIRGLDLVYVSPFKVRVKSGERFEVSFDESTGEYVNFDSTCLTHTSRWPGCRVRGLTFFVLSHLTCLRWSLVLVKSHSLFSTKGTLTTTSSMTVQKKIVKVKTPFKVLDLI